LVRTLTLGTVFEGLTRTITFRQESSSFWLLGLYPIVYWFRNSQAILLQIFSLALDRRKENTRGWISRLNFGLRFASRPEPSVSERPAEGVGWLASAGSSCVTFNLP